MKKVNLFIIAKNLQWLNNLAGDKTKQQFIDQAEEAIDAELKSLPSGSGIDNGVKLVKEKSSSKKIVFSFGFHHMDENGFYDGWTNHWITITPSFGWGGYDMKISGPNRKMVKDYLYNVFNETFEFKPKN